MNRFNVLINLENKNNSNNKNEKNINQAWKLNEVEKADIKIDCKFGDRCFKKNNGCPFNHPEIKKSDCRYGDKCFKKDNGCPFNHPKDNNLLMKVEPEPMVKNVVASITKNPINKNIEIKKVLSVEPEKTKYIADSTEQEIINVKSGKLDMKNNKVFNHSNLFYKLIILKNADFKKIEEYLENVYDSLNDDDKLELLKNCLRWSFHELLPFFVEKKNKKHENDYYYYNRSCFRMDTNILISILFPFWRIIKEDSYRSKWFIEIQKDLEKKGKKRKEDDILETIKYLFDNFNITILDLFEMKLNSAQHIEIIKYFEELERILNNNDSDDLYKIMDYIIYITNNFIKQNKKNLEENNKNKLSCNIIKYLKENKDLKEITEIKNKRLIKMVSLNCVLFTNMLNHIYGNKKLDIDNFLNCLNYIKKYREIDLNYMFKQLYINPESMYYCIDTFCDEDKQRISLNNPDYLKSEIINIINNKLKDIKENIKNNKINICNYVEYILKLYISLGNLEYDSKLEYIINNIIEIQNLLFDSNDDELNNDIMNYIFDKIYNGDEKKIRSLEFLKYNNDDFDYEKDILNIYNQIKKDKIINGLYNFIEKIIDHKKDYNFIKKLLIHTYNIDNYNNAYQLNNNYKYINTAGGYYRLMFLISKICTKLDNIKNIKIEKIYGTKQYLDEIINELKNDSIDDIVNTDSLYYNENNKKGNKLSSLRDFLIFSYKQNQGIMSLDKKSYNLLYNDLIDEFGLFDKKQWLNIRDIEKKI